MSQTLQHLRKHGATFSRLISEYGSQTAATASEIREEPMRPESSGKLDASKAPSETKAQAALMQAEERAVGAVSFETYRKYFNFAGGISWAPVLVGLLILTQGATGME